MQSNARHSMAQGVRRAALPLGCYYAVTLLLPLVNGAGESGAFLDHALMVATVPLGLVAIVAAACEGVGRVAGAVPLRRTVPNPTAQSTRGRGPVPPRMSAAREAERRWLRRLVAERPRVE